MAHLYHLVPRNLHGEILYTVFYSPRQRGRGNLTLRDDDFTPYAPERLPAMATLPEETAAYCAEAVAARGVERGQKTADEIVEGGRDAIFLCSLGRYAPYG